MKTTKYFSYTNVFDRLIYDEELQRVDWMRVTFCDGVLPGIVTGRYDSVKAQLWFGTVYKGWKDSDKDEFINAAHRAMAMISEQTKE